MIRFLIVHLLILMTVVLIPFKSMALPIIRDVELEGVIREILDPILVTAGQDPAQVKLLIVNDKEVNAYVAGGMNMFINTGLLTLNDDPEILAGVMAHETGHIAGGHLNKMDSELQQKKYQSVLTYLLGVAAIAAGSPGAGQAIMAGGQQLTQQQLLQFSRSHEDIADQSAINYLTALSISPKGLLFLLNYLGNQASQQFGKLNPYLQTHPLSRERMDHIQHALDQHKGSWKGLPANFRQRYTMAIAKLKAYISTPEETLKRYPLKDVSAKARYARSIAYFKKPYFDKSILEMDELLKTNPTNPYYWEMKAQILFEHGQIEDALPCYEKANKLKKNPLLMLEWAMALIANQDRKENIADLDQAIALLEKVLITEPENSLAWYQQGIAQGRKGLLGQSYMSFAEDALLQHKKKQVLKYLALAKKNLPDSSPLKLRMEDMKAVADKMEETKR